MAWEQNLQDASFRGVPFDCISTSDLIHHEVVQHTVPYTNGAELEATGSGADPIRIQAIFFGDDYETRLNEFLAAVRVIGPGELVHPVFGALQAVVQECEQSHDAERPDTCLLNLTFLRDGLSVPVFTDKTLLQRADDAMQAADTALAQSTDNLAAQAQKIGLLQNTLAGIKRAARFADRCRQAVGQLREFTTGIVSAAYNVIDAPRAFAADIAALADGMIDLRDFDKEVIMAQWRGLTEQFSRALRLPNDGKDVDDATRQDDNRLSLFLGVQEFNVMTQAAVVILGGEADTPSLTPAELEEITDTLRTRCQALIDQHREQGDDVDSREVVESLKTAADTVQQTASALLALKPPLVERKVEQPISLRLLAFQWYGDHERATELLRLNPQIRHPNFLAPGDVLHAYAE